MRSVVLFLALAVPCLADDISAARIRADVKFLASDLMEGRGVGTRGGDLATEFIATQFAVAGLKPAGEKGTFFQEVPMVGVATDAGAQLSASAGGKTVQFKWAEEFVGAAEEQKPLSKFAGVETVFVGHGIVAPEFQWNDYQGVDVKGKIVVLFTSEPPSDDPAFFGGKALTYYGRWTYKYEEALRQGALGVVILHTTPTASYGWNVVRNSWGGETPFMKLDAGQRGLAFAGWLSGDAARKMLALTGKDLDSMLKAADTRGFKAYPLGIKMTAHLPTKLRPISSRNVIGMVEGSDPRLKNEYVVFTAHWDHLGIGAPVKGDKIYNGAIDNGTGLGVLTELARVWAALPQKPRRSAVFLSVTAEEGGLRGSGYYGEHPLFPPGKTALDVNFDALFPYGRTKDVEVTGADRTTAWPIVQAVAKRMNLTIKPDPNPSAGHYYRSDHFSLAKVGIPAFTVNGGTEFYGKPEGFGKQVLATYTEKDYHQPSDDFREDWDFAGLVDMARFGFLIATEVANQDTLPTWNKNDEFLPARVRSQR